MSTQGRHRPGLSRRRFPRGNRDGFALLEALLSVAILSGGLIVALEALRSGARLQDAAEKRLQAIYLLEETVAAVAADSSLAPGDRSGSFPPPNDRFTWSVAVSPVEGAEDLEAALLLVEARVEWPSQPNARAVQGSRYVWRARTAE